MSCQVIQLLNLLSHPGPQLTFGKCSEAQILVDTLACLEEQHFSYIMVNTFSDGRILYLRKINNGNIYFKSKQWI